MFAQELEERVLSAGLMLNLGWAHHIRAIALRQLGQLDESQRQSEMAIHQFQAIGHAWGLAATQRAGNLAAGEEERAAE